MRAMWPSGQACTWPPRAAVRHCITARAALRTWAGKGCVCAYAGKASWKIICSVTSAIGASARVDADNYRGVLYRITPTIPDQRAHSNRKLRFQGFCRFIRFIERVFWSFSSTVRSDMHYWLAFSWPYNLLSDKGLRITVYSCANAPAGPDGACRGGAGSGVAPVAASVTRTLHVLEQLLRGYGRHRAPAVTR